MVEPLRHRQTKGAETDMFDLQLPRHISTLPFTTGRLFRADVANGALRTWLDLQLAPPCRD